MRRLLAVFAASAIALTACGGGSSSSTLPSGDQLATKLKPQMEREYHKQDSTIKVDNLSCVVNKREETARCVAQVSNSDGIHETVGVRITFGDKGLLWETE